ncbi:hypothetical protein TD95_003573 [Thielaviopsis punctulata]|uniref:Peptidase M20 dimerisation domain-containing protein n=1 Tax=Thielaviopsis punctulata TaxID=72032 RepID=A0A0F4ZIX3_9PEZI|nr:hypothetical protein TD95_003573 [Thielaviopsis punctulata]
MQPILSLLPAFALAAAAVQQPLSNPLAAEKPYRHDLLALHKSLVSTSSTSRNESAVGHLLKDYLEENGFTTQLLPLSGSLSAKPTRFNLLAWPASVSKSSGRVLLTSHIDVVPPHIPYSISDSPSRISPSTRISGRGSVDAKGSVAAQVIAMRQLLAAQAVDPSAVALLYVVGEEINGDGMEAFAATLASGAVDMAVDAAIFGEPTEGKLACGHKGGVFCRMRAHGKAAHSGYPELGKSANEALVLALARIVTTDLGTSEKYGRTTVNIGRVDGGVAANVIPAEAFADLGIRVAIGPTETGGEIVRQRVEEIMKEVDEEMELECGQSTYGVVECECSVPGFQTTIESYGTDIPHFRHNHTNYLYGPGSILVAHGDNEALTVGDLEEAVEGFQKLVLHALAN